jgi:hypothetical protein
MPLSTRCSRPDRPPHFPKAAVDATLFKVGSVWSADLSEAERRDRVRPMKAQSGSDAPAGRVMHASLNNYAAKTFVEAAGRHILLVAPQVNSSHSIIIHRPFCSIFQQNCAQSPSFCRRQEMKIVNQRPPLIILSPHGTNKANRLVSGFGDDDEFVRVLLRDPGHPSAEPILLDRTGQEVRIEDCTIGASPTRRVETCDQRPVACRGNPHLHG